MKETAKFFGLFSDETRLRIVMLIGETELCVCQIMAVLGISQPLVSRNIALLDAAGLLNERRDGKLMFYSLKKNLPARAKGVIRIVRADLAADPVFHVDMANLVDCREFQKKAGKCDMKTFLEFMEKQRKKRK